MCAYSDLQEAAYAGFPDPIRYQSLHDVAVSMTTMVALSLVLPVLFEEQRLTFYMFRCDRGKCLGSPSGLTDGTGVCPAFFSIG